MRLGPEELTKMRRKFDDSTSASVAVRTLLDEVAGQHLEIRQLRDGLASIGNGLTHNPAQLARELLASTYVIYHGPTGLPPDQQD